MNSGRFITLDGIEGGGKTTQISTLRSHLEAAGHTLVVTREPGGTPSGEAIRELLLSSAHTLHSETELLLMFAARAEHMAALINPALERGDWVVCDRFTDATYAYQGGGRGVAIERIAALETWLLGEHRPDLTLIFDLPPETGLARAQARRGCAATDRFEQQQLTFFQRARDVYRDRAARSPHRYRVIDAAQPAARVAEAVIAAITPLLDSAALGCDE